MASRVKKTKKKKKTTDSRITKIIGIALILVSLYLFIACTSYIFTWKADQDSVLALSWAILFESDVVVTNWLGRLGAVISSFLIYWGFGVSVFLMVPVIFNAGRHLIQRIPIIKAWPFFQKSFFAMCFFSVALALIFQRASFPIGGSFGTNMVYWLTNFVGTAGLVIMLLFLLVAWAVWQFNPSLETISLATPQGNFKIPTVLKFNPSILKFIKRKNSAVTAKPSEEREVALTPRTDDSFLRPNFSDEVAMPKTEPMTQSPKMGSNQVRSSDLELELPDTMVGEPSDEAKKPFEEIQIEQFGVPLTSAKKKADIEEQVSDFTLETTTKPDDSTTPDLLITAENKNHLEPFDPTLELSSYKYPPLELLLDYSDQKVEIDRAELEANKDQIIRTLLNYKIEITKIRATIGPTVTLYEIVPAPGVKISKIKNLEDDIALSLAALGIRIIAPIPGKGTIGIEVPNKKSQIVSFKEVVQSDKFKNAKMDLPLALGKTISNEVFVADLAKMPHLLIAGATGQGKSVGINTIISSLLYKKHPSQVKLVLIDPKKVELFPYGKINKHFLAYLPNEDEPIVTETSKVIYTLNSLCIEMDERYDLLKKARARNIKEYNTKFTARKINPQNGHKFMPFIVLVIDEFADLIMTAGKEVELPIARIAQLARAVGIHLIIATQRPSVNIITGVIKANFPARLAFKVTSKIDSRTILDGGGADQLIGRGDMLLSIGGNVVRLQCAFVDTPEVEEIVDHIGDQQGFAEPFYLPEYNTDENSAGAKTLSMSDLDGHFWDAAALVVSNQHGSTSMLQRKLQLGYNRAGRIMDQLEALGIVGEARGSKPREVLYFSEMELMNLKENMLNKK